MFPITFSTIPSFPEGHPVAVYIFFLVFPSPYPSLYLTFNNVFQKTVPTQCVTSHFTGNYLIMIPHYRGTNINVNRGFLEKKTGETTALFWDITQRAVVIAHRRFGTTYRSHYLPLKMGQIGWAETSVRNYFSLRNIPEEPVLILRGGSPKSRKKIGIRSPLCPLAIKFSFSVRVNLLRFWPGKRSLPTAFNVAYKEGCPTNLLFTRKTLTSREVTVVYCHVADGANFKVADVSTKEQYILFAKLGTGV